MIYATVNMTIGDYESTCDNKILLYRGDKNVEIRIVMKGNKFTVLDSTYAQMIIRRPSTTSVFSEPAPIQNDTVVFTVTEDMIDELKEIGEYTFQVRLYDDTMTARATLPPCNSALIIEKPIAVEGEAAVNLAIVNDSAVMLADTTSDEENFLTEDNKYIKTIWVDGDLITDVRLNKIENALYYINENGGGGSATAPRISTSLDRDVLVETGQNFNLYLNFSSSDLERGTLKVFINDVDSVSTKIDQGETTTVISGDLFTKGTNRVVVYVLDGVGTMSNSLIFYVRYGSTEISSTFDPYSAYDYGSTIRYYFTPVALDTSKTLTFYMSIDGETQAPVSCTSDTRSYFTFPNSLEVGSHYCEAWITDGTTKSNVLTFNLIIADDTSLIVASDTRNPSIEEGEQLVLDYKVYMKGNSTFLVQTLVDDVVVNNGTCGLDTNYYRTSSLTQGQHMVKVVVTDITETYSDYIIWTVNVTASTYEMLTPVTAGSLFIASAKDRTNTDENKDVMVGVNQDDQTIEASLSNFAYNNESGWVDDKLIISGNSWVDIPLQPLANNAKYGFTLDVEFSTKPIGVEDAEVLTLWNEEKDCGIKITTEELILRSAEGNQCDLYFAENETVSAIFVIDRDEKMAKIYLNGVMCEAFALSDYEANGVKYLEDFTVNGDIYLGGYNKNGYAEIKNIRVYEIALGTDEIINNFISNKQVKSEQQALVEFQKGDTLPTLTVYCDFSGLGKDDKKPCDIVYNSPDETLYGKSFTLGNKTSQLQYQGTSSMAYPIKNYRLNLRDENGDKWKYNPFSSGQPEARFTLKADFMSSGHWQNTGLAKWITDNLYNYKTNDEKSMNPMRWYLLQNGGDLNSIRESINGFPCRLILINDGETPLNEGQYEPTPGNTKDMGVFNFNNDKDNVATLGLDSDIFPNCASYEVTANSDTSAGAFMSYGGDGDESDELAYIKESFELRYPDEDDVAEDWGFMGVGEEGTGLKALIDWVDNCTDEEFVADFEEHFHKDYTLRYYLLVITLGMVDNLGKNMMLDTWDNKIFMPRFYDMDTICSYDNSGQIKFDVDIEMEQGYWNTSASRLWTRIRDLMHDDLVETYKDMRANGMSYESFMSYFYDQQISQIPQKYYNMDADVKYLPFADEYIGKAHGDGYEHLKRWLKKRLIFTDTLFDYAPSYNNDILTIRANTTEEMTLEIETYTPVYQHLSWYNGQMDKKKIDGKVSVTFSGKAQAATDQEVLIYGGSNIKSIKGLSSMNPNQMLIGGATRLIELDAPNCPLLVDINSNKANLSPHTYLNKVNLSGCSQLGGALRLNNSPLIQEINMSGTAITSLNLPSSIRNLEVMKLPNTITSLQLNDAGMLHTLEFDEGVKMQSVAMLNCNALTNIVNLDLLNTPSVSLDNSYNSAAELYFRDTTNLSLSNMSNLERVIFTPNNEYETFELINVANAPDYKVTTFNCPKLSTFMTTAPYRESYNNGEYGDIQPNTTFTANSIDISSTQFTDVKLLCTTDTNTLKLPTTVKNFYCDSSFDLDTDYLEDGEYDVVHGELVEQYTTDYEGEVKVTLEELYTPNLIPSSADGSLIFSMYAPSNAVAPASGTWDLYGLEFDNFYTFGMNNDVKQDSEGNITMPARYDDYNITIKNAYISPKTHNTMLYPLLVNEDNPITGTLDYTNYAGKYLSWSFAYTDEECVNIIQPKDELLNSYEYKYNAYYDTEYEFDNPYEIARYTSSASGVLPTFNTGFTYTYDEIDNGDGTYTTKINADSLDNLPTSISFNGQTNLLAIDNLNTSRVTNMAYMFRDCTGLTSLNLSQLNTSNVTDMANMFFYCINLTYLDASNWDTSNVTNMNDMFHYCYALATLDISNWDTSKVFGMNNMFYGCRALTTLDVSGFDTSNVTQMHDMFNGCYSLTTLDVSGFDTSKVTNMSNMFYGCIGLTSLDVSGFDTGNVTNMQGMFNGCSGLTSLNVNEFDTSKVTNMSNMFYGCIGLTSLDVSGFDTGNVTNMQGMFNGCSGLTSLNVNEFDTSNVTNMISMFSGCSGLTSLDVSGFNTSKVTDMTNMFYGCSGLTSLNVTNWSLDNVNTIIPQLSVSPSTSTLYGTVVIDETTLPSGWIYDSALIIARYTASASGLSPTFNTEFTYTYDEMDNGDGTYTTKIYADSLDNLPTSISFNGQTNLLTVDKLNAANATTMYTMFQGCSGLTSLNLSNFDTSNVTNMAYMLDKCSALTTLDVSGFDTSEVTNMASMFNGCSSLTTLDVSGFDTSKVTNMSNMFYGCIGLTSLDVSGFDTSKVTDMANMFNGCSGLTSLDVSGFDTGNVTTMIYMFHMCSSLTTLDLSGFDTSKVTNMSYMFNGCSNLEKANGNFILNSVNCSNMFQNCSKAPDLNEFEMNGIITGTNYMFFGFGFNNTPLATSLDLSNITLADGCGIYAYTFFRCWVTDIYPCKNINSYCALDGITLSQEVLMRFIDNLAIVTNGETLKLGTANLNKLTEEQIAIATNKGWTVS